MSRIRWEQWELLFLVAYAFGFYVVVVRRSLQLSHDHYRSVRGLRSGWMFNRLNDLSDAQWRNFRGNLPVLSVVFGIFVTVANTLRSQYHLKRRGMSIIWILLSLSYLAYLHGACIIFLLSIATLNFILAKNFGRSKFYLLVHWIFNVVILVMNRKYEGYSFSLFGQHWAFLDEHRGIFRWQICFNLVTLRMISYGCDYHWSNQVSRFDYKKHSKGCSVCSSGNSCYQVLQETSIPRDDHSFSTYLCYLIYAPLYIAGPVVSFNAFAKQLGTPQKSYSVRQTAWYGFKWVLNLFLMETMTHFFYYNAFAISGLWRQLSPLDIFIIGYGVLNFMWLKFLLIWRYFRFWSLIAGIEAPENMPRCINNCHDLEGFWKSWHASFNRWLVRYMYIPLGGSQRKLLNVWAIFTFVAIWHDLEWKLLSWAWLTCIFLIPEILVKSSISKHQARSALGRFVLHELSAVAGAVTIMCLMVANLVGYVIGPSGINWLVSRLLHKEGLPVLGGIFASFYVGTKLMFHIRDKKWA
ncbi:uncharacterized protein A4U43_C08F33780 [Asparagus officinalis]|uniref:putative membrane-bound O-acyltransferase C24H6.01c n=1 Tax=Asparagus officinalis TaxID=4686 RepID=UPI00098E6693|nr:putative membrane-bound O-acyltransferase C24H6.01c [Asparagus officinalis]ONK61807.1 uncharacterized protein A4U43_C08F33780 [Asparagus officinalis]